MVLLFFAKIYATIMATVNYTQEGKGEVMEDWTSRFGEITEADKIDTGEDLKEKIADYMAKRGIDISLEALTLHAKMATIKAKAEAQGTNSLTNDEAKTLVERSSRLSHITGMMEVMADLSKFLKD